MTAMMTKRDIHHTLFDTAIGPCGVAWSAQGLVALALPERDEAATEKRLIAKSGSAGKAAPPPDIAPAIALIQKYCAGERVDFAAVPLDQIIQARSPVVFPAQHLVSKCGLLEPLDRQVIVAGSVGVHDARCLTDCNTDHPVGMTRVRGCSKLHERFVVGAIAELIAN